MKNKRNKSSGNIDTRLVHNGRNPEEHFGAVNTPVYRISTVLHSSVSDQSRSRENPDSFITYGRHGSPTSKAFEETVADLEGGYKTIAVGSGLAAICSSVLAFVKAGDHILVCDSVYSPTRRLCELHLKNFGIETTYYNPLIGKNISDHFKPNTRIVFTESPGSHSFEIQDIPAISEVCKPRGIMVLLDNTWSAGYYFKAFDHGVDVSIQAATKYYVGHSDAMLGSITTNKETYDQVRETSRILGYHAPPDDCYLGLRGMRTLSVRMQQHEKNALEVAKWLEGREEVHKVLHPAFKSCPGHDIWKRDFTGSSGLFSILLNPVPDKLVNKMIDELELFGLGASWGGFESLILRTQLTRNIADWDNKYPCVRLHVGLENTNDLIEDLKNGFRHLIQS